MKKRIHEQTFENITINLDGHIWSGCSFNNCVFRVEIGNFSIVSCEINACRLSFGGNAVGIINVLEMFYPGKLPFNGDRPTPFGKEIF